MLFNSRLKVSRISFLLQIYSLVFRICRLIYEDIWFFFLFSGRRVKIKRTFLKSNFYDLLKQKEKFIKKNVDRVIKKGIFNLAVFKI